MVEWQGKLGFSAETGALEVTICALSTFPTSAGRGTQAWGTLTASLEWAGAIGHSAVPLLCRAELVLLIVGSFRGFPLLGWHR